MISAFLLLVVAITSLLAIVLLVRGGIASLASAVGLTLEVIGATMVFFVANLLVGVVLLLVARSLSIFYTTLYEVADVSLLILAVLQAVTLTAWRLAKDR